MTTQPALKDCPFCGGVDMHVVSSCSYRVKCHGCFSTGPFARSRESAIAAWNSRTPDDEVVKVLEFVDDTLIEINTSNYNHDQVCDLNHFSVEAGLAVQELLKKLKGDNHG